MDQSNLCFTADIHGSVIQYKKLTSYVVQNKPDFVLLGGDLFPKDGGLWHPENKIRTIQAQERFISETFLPVLEAIGKESTVLFVLGNDDFASTLDMLTQLPKNVYLLHDYEFECADYVFRGYPYVGLTPFLQKDWEKWDGDPDVKIQTKRYKTQGFHSKENQHFPVDYEKPSFLNLSLWQDLHELGETQKGGKKYIYLFHEAPYGTCLDTTFKENNYISVGRHLGSHSLKKFIDAYQPYMTLHGHIHETVKESGKFKHQTKQTLSFSSGNGIHKSQLIVVEGQLENISSFALREL